MTWEGLHPPYRTIVADPPWAYDEGWPRFGDAAGKPHDRAPLPYASLSVDDIARLPVRDLMEGGAHLYLWTTNRYLEDAYEVAREWGFRPAQVLVWCKPPIGMGPGGAYANTAEFVIFGRRGSLPARERAESTWWVWSRAGGHSTKPQAFLDLVERVSPGPYVELFARQPRLGWDHWGYGYAEAAG